MKKRRHLDENDYCASARLVRSFALYIYTTVYMIGREQFCSQADLTAHSK